MNYAPPQRSPFDRLPAPIENEIPISQLPLAGLIFGDEMVPFVQNGVTVRSTVTAIALASGATPGLINKTVTLVYQAVEGQADFSLSEPDHFGNTYPLSISNALHVTVNGVRFIEDDGTGTFGEYTINIGSNTVTLLTPLNDGDIAVFDIFNINVQTVSLANTIETQPLTVLGPDTLSALAFVPDGAMTIIYVNGRAFSDDAVPPSFTVSGRTVTWVDPIYSISVGDDVVASYTYPGPGSGGGGGGGGSGIPEAPLDGKFYGRQSEADVGTWQQPVSADIADWDAALTLALVGYYPVSNPAGYLTGATVPVQSVATRTGAIILVHDDITDWSAATASFVPINGNVVINGNFAVNQRVQVSGVALTVGLYGHDRWKAGASGCTYTFTAALPDTTITITAGTLTQVIEAGMIEGGVYTLSWTGTAQARVYQGSPTGSYAASPIMTAPLTAGTNAIVEFNAGTMTRVKLEIGIAATRFNRKSLAESLVDCQRYYQAGHANFYGYSAATSVFGAFMNFPVTMRAAPTIAAVGSPTYTNASGWTTANTSARGFLPKATATALGQAAFEADYTASAEL